VNISQFSVRHPKLITMVVLIVIIIGSISLRRLPIDMMPDITYPAISISAAYENASPQEVEELITRPIEEAMSAVSGVEEISSESSEGSSRVTVSFSWGTDLDTAANDVRDRIDRVIRQLPEDVDRPTLFKFDPSSMPILILGASSNLDAIQLRRIIDEQVKYRIERVPGVASLDIRGGLEREIRVSLDINKVKALKIPLNQIVSSIRASNITRPVGTVERGRYEVIIRTPGEYTSLEQIRNTVVSTIDRVPVRLRDIASVDDTSQKVTRIVRVNGQPGVHLSVTKQSGTNTVEVARGVLGEVEKINRDIKQIKLISIVDSSDYIKRSISSVGSSALYGGSFAVIVLLFFLRSIASTAIISVAIPISIIAAFVLMYFSGFTLNIMTLGGLALGIGMLVDNAIVVLENIYRLREGGLQAEKAAVDGCHEVTGAVIASTLTTIVVFLPLIFIEGMAGIMFKQLALVVGFALLCSLAVALTVIPMLASRYLHPVNPEVLKKESLAHKFFRLSGNMFDKLDALYKQTLHFSLSHRVGLLTAVTLILTSSLLLVPLVGVELMPQSDEGEVRVIGEMEVGTKLSVVDETFRVVESMVLREISEEAESWVETVGGGFGPMSSGVNSGQMRIALKPKSERKRSSQQVAAALRRKIADIPGMIVRTRAGTGMFTRMLMRSAGVGEERVQVEIRGYDLDTADMLAQQVGRAVERVEGVTDVDISRESGSPEELIIVDRQKAADMNLTVSEISEMLETAIGGKNASYYREAGDEYNILVQFKDADKLPLDEVLNLTVTNNAGESVILRNIVKMRSDSSPVSIERRDQERIVTVSANTGEDRDLGSILSDIRENIQSIPVPSGFTINFTGEYEEQQETFRELAGVFILALILVYMVMVSLYESLRDPFVVMFSVPPAVIGVIWMLFLTGTTFNMESFIGSIMLGGIVVNNAIVLVAYINLLRARDKMPLRQAVEEAGRRRVRPILMTSFTTILALVPMALGFGEGGEFQAPLARAVIGGLLVSSMITLFIVPVVYFIFESRLENKKKLSLSGNSKADISG
jgi:hydrophobic/amphiphilic exporter-1 (mainly G- bacteria), HAE1 family